MSIVVLETCRGMQ